MNRSHTSLIALALSLCVTAAGAQTPAGEQVLRGNKVTESNLLDALTPDPEPVVTRSLKVTRDGAPTVPARKPSASLLITFETNSAELTAPAKKQLDVVAAALKNDRLAEYSFNVEGHADPRGDADGNLTLSQQRADSVREYLINTHGIAAERLKAEGRGDRDLLNRKVPSAPENRRVTIVTNLR
jgi:outer membrane protein OmpA-like peptidoglycan-associated protein